MARVLKWIGIIIGGLVGVVLILAVTLHFMGRSRLNNAPNIPVTMINIPTDEAAVARGSHLASAVNLCTECHAEGLKGQIFMDEAPIGLITAPNLTRGKGGVGAGYTDEDWIRAIRHGVAKDGRTLGVMPSNVFVHMSDEDLGAIIAYVKAAPPVDNELPHRAIMFPGTILFGVLGYGDLPISMIDHTAAKSVSAPAQGVTVEYGGYLAKISPCADCHGTKFAGLIEANGPPPGPNLTPGGELAHWDEADFFKAIRNGITPNGDTLDPVNMPWPHLAHMTDDELKAMWLYLQSIPPRNLGDNQ